jgi:hypothetical protein
MVIYIKVWIESDQYRGGGGALKEILWSIVRRKPLCSSGGTVAKTMYSTAMLTCRKSALKMKAKSSSETLVPTCKLALRHHYGRLHRRENLRSQQYTEVMVEWLTLLLRIRRSRVQVYARRPSILAQCRDSTLKLGHDPFLPNHFQFIVIHLSSYHSKVCSLS